MTILSEVWNNADHNDVDQINRQKYARNKKRLTVVSLDKDLQRGVFDGTSGRYETSFEHCTCSDFELRKLPCKHMYKLAYELGVIDQPQQYKFQDFKNADNELRKKNIDLPSNNVFFIEYKGSKGDISSRHIEIQKLSYVKNKLYVYAYCHMRKTVRQFLASGIVSMSYEGRQVNNFEELITDESLNPGELVINLIKQASKSEDNNE